MSEVQKETFGEWAHKVAESTAVYMAERSHGASRSEAATTATEHAREMTGDKASWRDGEQWNENKQLWKK
jgi:hypothetical protein